MKTNKKLVLIATIFIGLATNAQQSIQDKVEKLAQDLNANMAINKIWFE